MKNMKDLYIENYETYWNKLKQNKRGDTPHSWNESLNIVKMANLHIPCNPNLTKVVPKIEKCILKNMQRAKNKAILRNNKIGELPTDIKIYNYKTVCYMYKNKLTKTRIEFRNGPIYAVTWCMTKSTLHCNEQRRILSKYSSGSTHIHKGRKCTLVLLHTIFKNNSRWLENLSMKNKKGS